jgi:ABC-type phosphate/phosphonate transport system substrate-binding protein
VGVWCWAAIAAIGCSLFGGPVAVSAAEPTVKIGMVQGMFRDVQPAMVTALAKPFRSLMEKQSGLKGDVDICPDSHAMCDKLASKQLDLGVLHGFEFAWSKVNHPDLVPLVVAGPQGGIVQALVIVSSESNAQTLSDLKGDCIVTPRGAKAHCLLYLEKARSGLLKNIAGDSPMNGMTAEEALNSVSTSEKTACLVDAATWAGYQSLQPGAAKRLKVLMKSDPFPPSVLVMRRGGLDDATVTRLKSGLLTAHKTAQYKPLMMMWNLKGFDDLPSDYEQQLEQCLQLYPAPKMVGVPVKSSK